MRWQEEGSVWLPLSAFQLLCPSNGGGGDDDGGGGDDDAHGCLLFLPLLTPLIKRGKNESL